ncbi:MAG: DUF4384 domain-containing protein [candidate division WOR-3 bacterium]|nr:MAG: DUF4384 domain-containing protein [candidate division WOR-3 bacterium]
MVFIMLLSLVSANTAVNVSLWTDHDDAIYHPGELLTIYFTADQGCFLAVYNVDQGGGVTRLFPLQGDDGWVRGGQTYQLPPEYADYDYRVSGPEGVETIIAVASRERLPALQDKGPDIVTEVIDVQIKESEPAELIIVSSPRNCRIYITEEVSGEREYVGDTPRAIVLKPGGYIVDVKKAGFRSVRRSVDLGPGEKRKVFVRL